MQSVKRIYSEDRIIGKMIRMYETSKKPIINKWLSDIDSYYNQYRFGDAERNPSLFRYHKNYLKIFDKVLKSKISDYRVTSTTNPWDLDKVDWKEIDHYRIPVNDDLLEKWCLDLKKFGTFMVNRFMKVIEQEHNTNEWYNEEYDRIIQNIRHAQNKLISYIKSLKGVSNGNSKV